MRALRNLRSVTYTFVVQQLFYFQDILRLNYSRDLNSSVNSLFFAIYNS